MLNERELIEHWALRDVIQRMVIAIALCVLVSFWAVLASFFTTSWRGELLFAAAAVWAIGGGLLLRARHLWRRLEALEEFIP